MLVHQGWVLSEWSSAHTLRKICTTSIHASIIFVAPGLDVHGKDQARPWKKRYYSAELIMATAKVQEIPRHAG
jgi:hypothetical protein